MTLTPEQRDNWRANAIQGGTGWPHETLALLDALDAAEAARDTAERRVKAVQELLGSDQFLDYVRPVLDAALAR